MLKTTYTSGNAYFCRHSTNVLFSGYEQRVYLKAAEQWLTRIVNTDKVAGSIPGENISFPILTVKSTDNFDFLAQRKSIGLQSLRSGVRAPQHTFSSQISQKLKFHRAKSLTIRITFLGEIRYLGLGLCVRPPTQHGLGIAFGAPPCSRF